MLENTVIVANKYYDLINYVVDNPVGHVRGEFDTEAFENEVSQALKQSAVDLVIFDASAVKTDFLEAVRYIKLQCKPETRVIVIYPNLNDEAVIQQLLVYGIFDIVNPEIDLESMSDIDIRNKLTAELQWAIQEPTTFNKVADKLSISVITQNIIETTSFEKAPRAKKTIEIPSVKKEIIKPRLIGFYTDDPAPFESLAASDKYTIVSVLPSTEKSVVEQDFSTVDIIACEGTSADLISYIKSLVDVNKNKTVIVAGYKKLSDVVDIKGVNAFSYDGTPEAFSRQVSINSIRKGEEDNSTCKIIGVYGVKGGVGSTTLTALLAKEYKKKNKNKKIVAIDYSAKAGDLGEKFGITLDKDNSGNLFECVAALAKAKAEHLDISLLKEKVLNYCHLDEKSGVYVLPTSYTDIYKYTNYKVSTADIAFIYTYILDVLRKYFDVVFVDITKYGGFAYETSIDYLDKLILVGDGKLAATSHLLTEYDNLIDQIEMDNVVIVINRSDYKHNENEYDNLKVLQSRCDKNRIVCLPFDKKLQNEVKEMDTKANGRYLRAVNTIWDAMSYLPVKKKGLFAK